MTPIDQAISRCDDILANIDRIQREMRAATEKAQQAIQEAIAKLERRQ